MLRTESRVRSARRVGIVVFGFALAIHSSAPCQADPPRVVASVGELFRDAEHRQALISPGGDRVAIVQYERGTIRVLVRDVDSGRVIKVSELRSIRHVDHLQPVEWMDDDGLIVSWVDALRIDGLARSDGARVRHRIVRFDAPEDPLQFTSFEVGPRGQIVHGLPQIEGRVLFQPSGRGHSIYEVDLEQLELREAQWYERLRTGGARAPKVSATLDEGVVAWIPDAKGAVRAALTLDGEPPALKLWFRSSATSEWRVVRAVTDQNHFEDLVPLGFTGDGSKLLVASSAGRDRYGLYEYDPENDSLGTLLFEHPTAELLGVVYDYSGSELIGVRYIEEGRLQATYLGTADERLRRALDGTFPNRNPQVTGLSRDRRRATVLDTSASDPGAFWLVDLDSGAGAQLGRIRPWLDDNILASSRAFRVKSRDGLEVEALLTLPPLSTGAPPLLVMPHGGPIGVSDVRDFSPDIQYLARMGYAILRVNYRGSGSRGKIFESSGHRQWGRGIEDDIEAAVDHVIANQWVDGARICVAGSSYGGYSALMLVVRRPEAYRCAASLMGVSDIALLFNADDVWAGDRTTEMMAEIVGDPEELYAEQVEYSPVYRADRIRIPVLLAHGDWDRRVDRDHMVRMKLALDLESTSVRVVELRETGHGFRSRDDAIEFYMLLRSFLDEHIGPMTP